MPETIAEKILSAHRGKSVRAGEIVIADLDFLMGQDGTSAVAIDSFSAMAGRKVFDPSKIALVIDHSSPSPNQGVSAIHKKIREFAKAHHLILYDVGGGISHQLIPEQGHVVPGNLVIGADSHTCSYGAINVFSTGVGSSDLAAGMISGKLWFKVPETMKLVLNGRWPPGVYSKDLILFLIGQLKADGATYRSVEFLGEAVEALAVEDRFPISNMAVEMGAKAGLMRADRKVIDWVKKHSKKSFIPVEPDKDAEYIDIKEFDASKLEPQIAKPHTVDKVVPLGEVEGTPIQQGVIGTCTNGRIEDFRVAAKILRGRKVHKDARLICVPASRQIFMEALKEGIIQAIIEAGGVFLNPGCGPCVGTHEGIPADGENVISTANRNFKGRMGNPNAFIYLASPAAVAASVIEGKIADPRKYL